MQEQEGVIKFKLDHQNIQLEQTISIAEINAWRTLMFKLELIGQVDGRYDGYGFGNISQRLKSTDDQQLRFLISGTQTGGLEILSKHHYCIILEADPINNRVKSKGPVKPSSEALTHASVYLQSKNIQSVIHVHNPEIWTHSDKLKLPHTSANTHYGTPEMTKDVDLLFQKMSMQSTDIFSMLGHEDGIVAFSESMEKAANLLIRYYAKALALEPRRLSEKRSCSEGKLF